MRILAIILLALGASAAAMAVPAPEIDPASAGSAVALLAGVAVVYRGRRTK